MNKVIPIGDKEVVLECNAYTPIKYRMMFNQDLLTSLSKISEKNLDIEVISNLTYCMALQGGFDGDIEAFLSQFELTDFYAALPNVMELWGANNAQSSKPKKPQGK